MKRKGKKCKTLPKAKGVNGGIVKTVVSRSPGMGKTSRGYKLKQS